MAALIIHPEHHRRFHAYTIDSVISVDLDDDGGGTVRLAIELIQGEGVTGPKAPDREDRTTLLERGVDLDRILTPDEARALAAALWHMADAAERPR